MSISLPALMEQNVLNYKANYPGYLQLSKQGGIGLVYFNQSIRINFTHFINAMETKPSYRMVELIVKDSKNVEFCKSMPLSEVLKQIKHYAVNKLSDSKRVCKALDKMENAKDVRVCQFANIELNAALIVPFLGLYEDLASGKYPYLKEKVLKRCRSTKTSSIIADNTRNPKKAKEKTKVIDLFLQYRATAMSSGGFVIKSDDKSVKVSIEPSQRAGYYVFTFHLRQGGLLKPYGRVISMNKEELKVFFLNHLIGEEDCSNFDFEKVVDILQSEANANAFSNASKLWLVNSENEQLRLSGNLIYAIATLERKKLFKEMDTVV